MDRPAPEDNAAAMATPAELLDKELGLALHRFHRLRWMLVGAVALMLAGFVALGAAVLYSQHVQLAQDGRRLLSSCDFWRPLTSAPVTVNPATGRPTELAVAIIAGSREAYAGQGCPGPVPRADPSLLHWAAYYHLHLSV